MRTILEEVLLEEYPGKEAHGCSCGCSKCNDDIELEALFKELENKISIINTSCQPERYKRNKLTLNWWGKRTRIPRNIPKDIDLAILSRGQIKLPITNMEWLLNLAKGSMKAEKWITRLPDNFHEIIPEVDVTFELFIEQIILTDEEKLDSINEYLARRHKEELVNCDKGFYVFNLTKAETSEKIEKLSGVPLQNLFQKANVHTPSKMKDVDKELYYLLTYISFPNEIESKLIWSDSSNNNTQSDGLTANEIEQFVWALIGEKPKTPNPFWSFYKFAGLPPYSMKKFFELFFKGLGIYFNDKPKEELKGVIGASYALMDASTGYYRGDIDSVSTRKGYHSMKKRLIDIENIPNISARHRGTLEKLARVASKSKALEIIYRALLPAYRNVGNTQGRSIMAEALKHCRFDYPILRSKNCNIL